MSASAESGSERDKARTWHREQQQRESALIKQASAVRAQFDQGHYLQVQAAASMLLRQLGCRCMERVLVWNRPNGFVCAGCGVALTVEVIDALPRQKPDPYRHNKPPAPAEPICTRCGNGRWALSGVDDGDPCALCPDYVKPEEAMPEVCAICLDEDAVPTGTHPELCHSCEEDLVQSAPSAEVCGTCKGSGWIRLVLSGDDDYGLVGDDVPCDDCNGTGQSNATGVGN